ncbi:MAG: hypothetical protein GY897_13985 [Alteromonas sp.]|nr:hypothetical protein [Alteromonas sp.]
MRWQIANYQFCEQQQTLSSPSETLQLEPMMVELLAYFCRHPNEIISVDQLIDQVWQGRVVTDNAVSRLITKLRRAFADDARQPRFIATFPKKGYKFVARVVVINEGAFSRAEEPASATDTLPQAGSASPKADTSRLQLWGGVGFLVVASLLIFWLAWQTPQPSASFARALTSRDGNEFFPSFSADGTRMAFMSVKERRLRLVVKDLTNGQALEVTPPDGLNTGPGDWSQYSDNLVYLAASDERCEYYIREFNGLTPKEARLIHRCPAGSYGKILFTHNDERVVFSENSGPGTPYSIYELDLTTQTKRRVNQPDIYLSGNSQFDMHPEANQLLISSPDKQQWEGFYTLDLQTNELNLLFKQDAYICCGIWDHSGENVILMGEHPAYQLLSYNLSGGNRQVVYSGSRRINQPNRFNNGVDYVFASGDKHSDIVMLELTTHQISIVANDTVDERLARFSTAQHAVAYISMVSGKEQVWIYDTRSKARQQVTAFTDNRHYLDLQWSLDDRYIVGFTFNELHLINVKTGEATIVDFPQTEIRGVSFKSASELSFSAKEGERWRVYTYNLSNQTVSAESPQWSFIQFRANGADTLWYSHEQKLYFSDEQVALSDQDIPVQKLLDGRQWNLRKQAHHWYWYNPDLPGQIYRYNQQTAELEVIAEARVGHFDIREDKLLYIQSSELQSNLFRTVSQ